MRLTRSTAAAVVALTLAAGCAGDREDSATTTSTTERAKPTTTADPEVLDPVPSTTTTTAPAGPPVAASDPDGLAAQLVEVERKIRTSDPDAIDERTGHLHQLIFRQLVNRPELKDQVRARLPEDLRGSLDANFEAGAGLRAMIKPRDALPDQWRIVAPAPAEELMRYYKDAEAAEGVPWYYLASINLVETRMGRIRGVSTAGAQGPMQFMPATWEQYGNGGDIHSPRDAIHAAARLLKRNGAPQNMDNAVFNYNRDRRYVRAVINYAHQMRDNERTYFGYYHWQVYYVTVGGDRWLPVGYPDVPSPPAA